MRDEDKPFICYQKGWSMQIEPRNRTGWIYLALWVLAVLPVTAAFGWLLNRELSSGQSAASITAFVLVMMGWGFAMVRWMKARSEVIDTKELLALKRERDAQKRRGRG